MKAALCSLQHQALPTVAGHNVLSFAVIKMVFLPSALCCRLRSINPSVADLQTDQSLQSQTVLQTSQQSVSSNMSFVKGVPCVKHTD